MTKEDERCHVFVEWPAETDPWEYVAHEVCLRDAAARSIGLPRRRAIHEYGSLDE